ncbi:transcriptional regulator Rgg family [Lactococcus lactis subsp. lactis]|uniref:Transcriptional regulator Rgg family n=1 Tax=Lactococcus lactis subsp. lactis TaxID=1360 RepID=A0A0V8DEP6_LACLL|nr:hypothetical protein [Lactococcus lactis]KSU12059.1 transcriptional regulator Rgg family [Lactococcus lactis subsp. lactis]
MVFLNIAEEFFNLRIERSFCFPQNELVTQLRSILQKSYPKDDFYDLYVENLRNLAHGFYSYCFKDKISGEKQIKNAIEIFGQVGYEDLAYYYQKRYQKLLGKLLT